MQLYTFVKSFYKIGENWLRSILKRVEVFKPKKFNSIAKTVQNVSVFKMNCSFLHIISGFCRKSAKFAFILQKLYNISGEVIMDNFDGIDVERENQISREYYNKGYYDGMTQETQKLVQYLCSLSDIELIRWKQNNIAMSKLTKDDFLAIATALRNMAK